MNELKPSSFADHEYWIWDEDADDGSLIPMPSVLLCDNGERDFNSVFCLITAQCSNGNHVPAIVGVSGSDLWVYVVELFARDHELAVHRESSLSDTAGAFVSALGDHALPIVLHRKLEFLDCNVDVAIYPDSASNRLTFTSNSIRRARHLPVGAHATLGGYLVVGPTVLLYGTPDGPEVASVDVVEVANGAALRHDLVERIPLSVNHPTLLSGHARVEGRMASAGGRLGIVATAVRFFREGFTYDIPVVSSR